MRSFFKMSILFFFLLFSLNKICYSTSYYIDSLNGSDSNTGKSNSQAWKTLKKINQTSFKNGDDIYLRCGSNFKYQKITVSWPGTKDNRVVIGAYYMAGGVETVGVNGDGKPIIDGNNSYPTSKNSYLVGINNDINYVTIQDLNVIHSNQYGIKVSSGAKYCTIQRDRVDDTYLENIFFAGSANYGKVEYCELTRGSRLRLEMIGACRGWPPGGIKMTGTLNGIIEYNKVYNQYAEGIIVGSNSTCKFNVVGDSMGVGIYIQSQHSAEVAYNLVYGTDTNKYNSYSSCKTTQENWKGNGIAAGLEVGANYGDLYDVKIHHNIVINRESGLRVYNSNATARLINMDIYNNTLIDNEYNFHVSNVNGKSDGVVIVRDNISYPNDSRSKHLNADSGLDHWIIDHNDWAIKAAPKGEWSGAGDITTNPKFFKTNWKGSINQTSDFIAKNFTPTDLANGSGIPLDPYYKHFIDPKSNFNTSNPDPIIGHPINVKLDSLPDLNLWPMGAIEFNSDSTNNSITATTLYPPSGISITAAD